MIDDRCGKRTLYLGSVTLESPVFFPSVSSVKTALSPKDYVSLLNALNGVNKQYLVSAFDLCRGDSAEQEFFRGELLRAAESGSVVLMDSGNYESFWKDAHATWTQDRFHQALTDFPCPLAFAFDEQRPPDDFDGHVRLICDRYALDQSFSAGVIIPIIHGVPSSLPSLCAAVASSCGVPILAVAERQLGDGIFERVQTVAAIRNALDETGQEVGLHLLGTGNPISIALFSMVGADSFDGLEWCQTVVDHESGLLHHLSQGDFFKRQTGWHEMGLSFHARTLAHNLEFFNDWLTRLREAFQNSEPLEFCRLNLPPRIFNQCNEVLGWSTTK